MRISDWSSDVCSSDLHGLNSRASRRTATNRALRAFDACRFGCGACRLDVFSLDVLNCDTVLTRRSLLTPWLVLTRCLVLTRRPLPVTVNAVAIVRPAYPAAPTILPPILHRLVEIALPIECRIGRRRTCANGWRQSVDRDRCGWILVADRKS